MPYSPDDIVNVELKQSVRGYSIPQVDALLDELADQVEASERELQELRSRIRDAEARLASALETESTLKRTLVTAQQAAESSLEEARADAAEMRAAAEADAERVREEARRESEAMLEQARRTAAAEADAARQQRAAIESRIDTLREVEQRHRSVLRRHLEEQLAVLDNLSLPPVDPEDPVEDAATGQEELPAGDLSATPVGDQEGPGLKVRVHPTTGQEE